MNCSRVNQHVASTVANLEMPRAPRVLRAAFAALATASCLLALAQHASGPLSTASVERLIALAESDHEDVLRRIGAVRELEQRERARQLLPELQAGRGPGMKASDSPMLAALKQLTVSQTDVVAQSAVGAFSRLGDAEEVVAVLLAAQARGITSPEELARELAINMPGMPDHLLAPQVAQVIEIAGQRGPAGEPMVTWVLQAMSTRCAHLPITDLAREAAQRAIDWSKARRGSWVSVQRQQLMLVQNTHVLEARLIAGREEARMTDELYRAGVEAHDPIDLLAVLVSAYGDEVASRIAAHGHLDATRLRLSKLRGGGEADLDLAIAEAQARLRKAATQRASTGAN